MIDMHSKYDAMHKNRVFNALIWMNNHTIACYHFSLHCSISPPPPFHLECSLPTISDLFLLLFSPSLTCFRFLLLSHALALWQIFLPSLLSLTISLAFSLSVSFVGVFLILSIQRSCRREHFLLEIFLPFSKPKISIPMRGSCTLKVVTW